MILLMLPTRETLMQFKTIVLELMRQRPQLYKQLKKEHSLLLTVEICARQLKERQQALQEVLAQANPGSNPSQVASEALEIAVKELEERLPPAEKETG